MVMYATLYSFDSKTYRRFEYCARKSPRNLLFMKKNKQSGVFFRAISFTPYRLKSDVARFDNVQQRALLVRDIINECTGFY